MCAQNWVCCAWADGSWCVHRTECVVPELIAADVCTELGMLCLRWWWLMCAQSWERRGRVLTWVPTLCGDWGLWCHHRFLNTHKFLYLNNINRLKVEIKMIIKKLNLENLRIRMKNDSLHLRVHMNYQWRDRSSRHGSRWRRDDVCDPERGSCS